MASKTSAAEQKATMQSLNQQAAAWLLDRPPTWLRDHSHEVPRNSNGTYDASALLQWRTARPVDVNRTDAEQERLQQAAELVSDSIGNGAHAILQLLSELRDQWGDAGLALFAESVLDACGDADRAPSADSIERQLQSEVEDNRRWRLIQHYRAMLQSVYRCPGCEKVRRGRKWSATTKRYPPETLLSDPCPKCKAKGVDCA